MALVAALTAALSFDFFLTRPYYSFRITRHQDLITELLLLVLGIAVGELAARGRGHLREATQSKETVALLHSVTELVAAGREPREVINAAFANLQQLLGLEDCYFTRRDPGNLSARINPQGELTVAGQTWATEDLGTPDQPGRPPGARPGLAARPLRPHTDPGSNGGGSTLADGSRRRRPGRSGAPRRRPGSRPQRRYGLRTTGRAPTAKPRETGVTDALFIGAFVAFIAVMFGFVFLYDRSVAGSECDAPERSAEDRPTG